MDRTFPLLLLCFFLSGLAALIYETAWTREFAFVFGTSDLAVATVLAAYMGGLALGAAVAGRVARRIQRPVLVYGLLELGIAITALAVPLGIAASRWLYVALFGGLEVLPDAGGVPTALFYLVCSFAILIVPTAMMGATLPLLARHAVREVGQIGRRVGVLYAVNTAGAVSGVLLGAFVLLPWLGLRITIVVAAGINALVFAAAWALARTAAPLPDEAPAREADPDAGRAAWILPLITFSGFASFTYEVLWVRLLGHVVGASVHAFATMLASFLLGIALGAAVASRLASSPRRAAAGFATAQLGIAALSALAFWAVNRLPMLSEELLRQGLDRLWTDTGMSMATLFPAALCIGATFPFAVRMLARQSDDAGPASARVYSWNTVGSIAGSLCAAFFLIPGLGFEGTLALCLALNLVLAASAAWIFEPRRPLLLGAAAVGLVALTLAPPDRPWGVLRSSSMSTGLTAWGQVAYFGVGRSSTVLVIDQRSGFALRTNGLPEAGMVRAGYWHNTSPTTRWLTALPVFARPETRTMLVIGFGGGMLLEVVPSSVERIDVVELEPEVIEANRSVGPERWRDPLTDPRVHLHLNDARNALLLANRRYDAIVSQPSHPWAGGAAHLYTQEFFERVESRLSDDGVFVQWIGLPFVDEELFRSLLAALAEVFDYVEAYQPPPGGSILFLASNAPLEPQSNAARAIAQNPDDMQLLGIHAPEDVVASLQFDAEAVRKFVEGATPNRDGHNRLQNRSARLGDDSLRTGFDALVAPADTLALRPPDDADFFYLLGQISPTERKQRLVETLEDPVDRITAEAIVDMERGKRAGPLQKLEEALEADPRHREARAAFLRLSARQLAEGRSPGELLAEPLSPAEQVVAQGWRAREADASGETLLQLDEALAAIPITHPLGHDAARLRAQGRVQTGDLERIREAVDISEASLSHRPDPRSLLIRAEVFSAAEEDAAVLQTLSHFLMSLHSSDTGVKHPALTQRARILAQETDADDPEIVALRRRVFRGLGIPGG